jgi:hypothetical protein
MRLIARKSGAPISLVIALWAAILEEAAQHRGSLTHWDAEEWACLLDTDADQIEAIIEAMQGRLMDGLQITNWEKRQYRQDGTNAERQRRYRARNGERNADNAVTSVINNADVTGDNDGVTAVTPSRNDPDTDTDTDSSSAESGSKGRVCNLDSESHIEGSRAQKRASAPRVYVWEGQVIRLVRKDYDLWRKQFHKIEDLDSELAACDAWLVDHPPNGGKWFGAAARWLKKAHDEARPSGWHPSF